MQVAILAALHEKPRRFRALPERLQRGFGSAVTGSKFPTTRLLIPKFRLVDSHSTLAIFGLQAGCVCFKLLILLSSPVC